MKMYDENYETIAGVQGQWLTVTNAKQVSTGQRVRYSGGVCQFGYTEPEIIVVEKDGTASVYQGACADVDLFSDFWKNIQVFCPSLPVERKKAKKVAKVVIDSDKGMYWFLLTIGKLSPIRSVKFASRKSTIRSAQRLCELIGYECEIAK